MAPNDKSCMSRISNFVVSSVSLSDGPGGPADEPGVPELAPDEEGVFLPSRASTDRLSAGSANPISCRSARTSGVICRPLLHPERQATARAKRYCLKKNLSRTLIARY